MSLWDYANFSTDLLLPGLVAAGVTTGFNIFAKRREIRDNAEIDYEYQQKTKLKEIIGLHKGRLVHAASSYSNRMNNFYVFHEEGWQSVHRQYDQAGYYFTTFAYRLMQLMYYVQQIKSQAILIDDTFASGKDEAFLNFAHLFSYMMSDASLLKKTPNYKHDQIDHIYSDNLPKFSRLCEENNEFITVESFKDKLVIKNSPIAPVLSLLDGLCPEEDRGRWDRLVSLHLVVMAFLNQHGLRRHQTAAGVFRETAQKLRHPVILEAVKSNVKLYDLDKVEATQVIMKL